MSKCLPKNPLDRSGLRKESVAMITCLLMLLGATLQAQPVFLKNLSSAQHFKGTDASFYFITSDSLFTSDGTPSGTVFVEKITEPVIRIASQTIGDRIFMVTQSGSQQGLWTSDGTADGTFKIAAYRSISPLIVFNSELYLRIDDGTYGAELWKLDASFSLARLYDIHPGPGSGVGFAVTISNGELYFKGVDTDDTDDLWKTDGTTAGTMQAVDFHFLTFGELNSVGGTIYVTRNYEAENTYDIISEIWKTEGTEESTQLLKRYETGGYLSYINRLMPYNGKMYFLLTHGAPQTDLMVTDGTPEGTVTVKERLGFDGEVYGPVVTRGEMVFFSETQGFPNELVRSDGTFEGTTNFHDIVDYFNYTSDFSWVNLTSTGDLLFFADVPEPTGDDDLEDLEIYQSDLTPANTRPLKEIYGMSFAGTDNITAAGSNVFFTTSTPGSGIKLWFYDPTTVPVCQNTGALIREVWTNVSGNKVASIPVNTPPSYIDTLSSFEGPVNQGDRYGSRYRALLCVPETGDYQFFIASNDEGELWLSTDASSANKTKIAHVPGYSNPREYTRHLAQASGLIRLTQGQNYYIEALHKEGVGTDHLSVAMRTPQGEFIDPIPGSYLIPFGGSDGLPPEVELSVSQTEYTAPASIFMQATASDPDGEGIRRVEFYSGTDYLGVDGSAPYSLTWSDVGRGTYTLTAIAYDADEVSTVSNSVTVVVNAGCTASGVIQREVWTNVQGSSVSQIPLGSSPDEVTYPNIFEAPSNIGNHYGTRMSGYICPPITGYYVFYIASNDNSELWVSTDDDPANKERIAYVIGATSPRQWSKYPSQTSAAIYMESERRYYIEALHKQGVGSDNLAVGWRLADGTYERPIPGSRLSPFEPQNAVARARGEENAVLEFAPEMGDHVTLTPNPVKGSPVTLTLSEFYTEEEPEEVHVEIVSTVGSRVFSKPFNCQEGCRELTLDIQDKLSTGVYIVHGTVSGKRFSKRLIVK